MSAEKNKSKRIVYAAIVSLISFACISGLSLIDFYSKCYDKDYIFINEYLADYNSKDETKLISCNNCLWIEAIDIETGLTKKLFFAKEYELRGFEHNEKITMRWCKSSTGYRISGVWNG